MPGRTFPAGCTVLTKKLVPTFRRMRRSIMEAANNSNTNPDTKVVLAGMANVYTHYITTFEEYQVQVVHHLLQCSQI